MKRSLLLIVFAALSLSASESNLSTIDVVSDVEAGRIVAFEKPYDLYFRTFFGCVAIPAPTTRENCGNNPHLDARAKLAAREAAKKLFDLAEPK